MIDEQTYQWKAENYISKWRGYRWDGSSRYSVRREASDIDYDLIQNAIDYATKGTDRALLKKRLLLNVLFNPVDQELLHARKTRYIMNFSIEKVAKRLRALKLKECYNTYSTDEIKMVTVDDNIISAMADIKYMRDNKITGIGRSKFTTKDGFEFLVITPMWI